MEINLKLKVGARDFLENILAFLFVIECNTVYQRMTNINLHLEIVCLVAASLLLIFTMNKKLSKKSTEIGLIFLAIAFVYLLLTINKCNVRIYVSLICLFFPIMIIYLLNKGSVNGVLSLYQKFSTIVVWLTVMSTTVWFLTEIAGVLSPNMSAAISWGNNHVVEGVYGLYFRSQIENTFGLYIYRNSGIFCEAPMFSLVVSFALIYELFLHGEIRRRRVVILIVGILTSMTSTGIVILILCFGLMYWQKIKTHKKTVRFLYLLGMVVLIPVAYSLFMYVFEAKSVRGSYSIRMADYIVGFQTFLKYPFTGSGYGSISQLIENKASVLSSFGIKSSTVGYSNSLTAVLGQGGIYLFSLYILPFAILLTRKMVAQRNYAAWDIAFMFLFSVTIFYAKFVMMYFLAATYAIWFTTTRETTRRESMNSFERIQEYENK